MATGEPKTSSLKQAQKHWDRRDYSLAIEAFLRGQGSTQDSLGLVCNVAQILLTLRRSPEALALLEQGVRVDPSYQPLHENLLAACLHTASESPRAIAKRHFDWAKLYPSAPSQARLPAVPKRIRVGYVSPNFNFNPEVFFTLPLIRGHDKRRFEVFCYSAGPVSAWTAKFRRAADHWRNIAGQDDARAAELIRKDGIHILVDLTGHFAGGRLPIFAHRPAPVQVSFPTYPATTGLPAIQYRITDGWADPADAATARLYSEALIRLPHCYCCYEPPPDAPAVAPPPMLRDGRVTFGVFNRTQKITNEMLRLWAKILAKTQGSRLLFHHVYNGPRSVQPEFTEPILAVLGHEGIAAERVRFAGMRSSVSAHLAVFNEVDISLDTYPYHGMTTTCESLWMGVPVVTLAGRSHVARVGVSLNSSVGLTQFIAANPTGYVRAAVRAAADPEGLKRLRFELRARMSRSICDNAAYVKSVENAYRTIWELERRKLRL